MSLICPLCHQQLLVVQKSYICKNKHCFDISSEGYVNLLVSNKKSSGDDQMMVQARRDFLSGGWYTPLIDLIATRIEAIFPQDSFTICDLGCGEGWYMHRLQEIRNNNNDSWYGLDISKYAVKIAAKKTRGTFIVGNAYHIPLADQSCDVILSIFSPYDEKELQRCLKPGGVAIIVGPGPAHLYRFIELIRDNPHQHIIKTPEEKYTLLDLLEANELQIPLLLHSPALQDLFKMTPYYRQAPREKQEKILQMESIELIADFRIEVARK